MKHRFLVIFILLLIFAGGGMMFFRNKRFTNDRVKPLPVYSQSPLFQNLETELTGVELEITGEMPAWIEGTFVRNGPAKFHAGGEYVSHWFDGLAMLHAFTLEKGKVVYSNKFLHSDPYEKMKKTGTLSYAGFAQDPCRSLFKNLFTFFLPKEEENTIKNANVNVAKIADHYVAMTETPLPVRFDITTLETLGALDYEDSHLKEKCFESAHPHYDRESNALINYYIDFGRKSYYVLYTISEGSTKRKEIARIPVDKPAYIHSFALSENAIVFVEFPFVVSPIDLKLKGGGFISHFKWEPQRGTRFHVIDKKNGGVVKTLQGPAFFSFHHANAFEKDDSIIVDLVSYSDASILTDPGSKNIERCFSRFTLNLSAETVKSREILSSPVEMPRINYEAKNGLPYRYCYALGSSPVKGLSGNAPLVKLDVETGKTTIWKENGCFPSEPVFLSKPGGQGEDEGVVLSVVLDLNNQNSFLLVLDGETFNEIARAGVPHQIPMGLHGMFFGRN